MWSHIGHGGHVPSYQPFQDQVMGIAQIWMFFWDRLVGIRHWSASPEGCIICNQLKTGKAVVRFYTYFPLNIHKIAITRSGFDRFSIRKSNQNDGDWGSTPDPAGSFQRSPDPLAVLKDRKGRRDKGMRW